MDSAPSPRDLCCVKPVLFSSHSAVTQAKKYLSKQGHYIPTFKKKVLNHFPKFSIFLSFFFVFFNFGKNNSLLF